MLIDDMSLVREYARTNSDEVFATLVARHINLVYSIARQHTRDQHLAEEITQAVFLILARKAGSLRPGAILSGWLCRTARYTSANALKMEKRRQHREQEAYVQSTLNENKSDGAWDQLAPLLGATLAQLRKSDHDVIVLRFFENKNMTEVGAALGVSENTAKTRVSRAVEKLRRLFLKRGVALSTATISGAIAANSIQAAPAGLASAVTLSAAQGSAVAVSTTNLILSTLKYMAWTKTQTVIVGLVVVASLLTPMVLQQQAQTQLLGRDETRRKQSIELARLQSEHGQLTDLIAGAELSRDRSNELQRLRAELGPLQQQGQDVASLRQENQHLKAALDEPKSPMQIKERMIAKAGSHRDWLIAFHQYAAKNNGQLPPGFEEAAAFLPKDARAQANPTSDNMEIVYQGSLRSLTNAADIIVLREKEAWQNNGKGNWLKYYGYADGSVRLQQQPDGNFDEYEKQHMAPNP